MRLIRIGMSNIDNTVGALRSNTDKVIQSALHMQANACTVGCFQEMVIGGYPAEDLVQWSSFVNPQLDELKRFAKETAQHFPTVFTVGMNIMDYNVVAVVCKGEILGFVAKEKLPTYSVHYDGRTFSRGIPYAVADYEGIPIGDLVFSFPFGCMAVEVCEDIWSPDGPMRRRSYHGAELIVNASSSPFRAGVLGTRREMISTRAGDNQCSVVYVNQVGGNDSLVFDGGGFVNQNGRMISEAPRWREGVTFTDIDLDVTDRKRRENTTWRCDREEFIKNAKNCAIVTINDEPLPNHRLYRYPVPAHKNFFMPAHDHATKCPREEYFADLVEAMLCGLDGYFKKTRAFSRIGIALSGGKDSALTACIARLYAKRAYRDFADTTDMKKIAEGETKFAKGFVQCFSMPTRFNSDTTKSAAKGLCDELDLGFAELAIEDAFEREIEAAQAMLGAGESLTDATRQNVQARVRGMRMWNWANSSGALWLQTSNMSEKAVGYATVGGDLMGCYSLIANLPKTVITALLEYLADREGWSSVKAIAGLTASAELKDNQADENDLMPFPVLDACIHLFVEQKQSPAEVLQVLRQMWSVEELAQLVPGYQPEMMSGWVEKFARLFSQNIFKWVLTPEAVHLGNLELDRERALQLPVVQSREWLNLKDK